MMDFTHKLQTTVKYQSGGENAEGKVIILSAPSNKQRRAAAKLKQYFFQSLGSLPDTGEATEVKDAAKEKTKGSDIVSLMNMSEVDLDEVHDAFMQLMIGGCASVDGKEPVTEIIYNEIQFCDTEAMLGDYLVNFLIPSF